jgi:ABC-type transport system substrate-binding protein
VDKAISEANTVGDDAERNKQYQAITSQLMDEAIFLPLYNVSGVFSTVANLKGLQFGPTGYAYFHTAALA